MVSGLAFFTSSTTREYETDYAAHILGTVGLIQAPDWDELKDKGYEILYLTDNVDEFALRMMMK